MRTNTAPWDYQKRTVRRNADNLALLDSLLYVEIVKRIGVAGYLDFAMEAQITGQPAGVRIAAMQRKLDETGDLAGSKIVAEWEAIYGLLAERSA